MNRDVILNMPAGKEMDTLIAEKVMGWHVVNERKTDAWHDSEGRYQHLVPRYDGYDDDEDFNLIFWHPSESIMWAWDVAEKFPFVELDFDTATWSCAVSTDGKNRFMAGSDLNNPSAPLAICRAALLAVLDE